VEEWSWSWLELRGKNSVSRSWRDLSVWKRSLLDIEAEIKERSRCRSLVHLLRAAKLLIANDACGATNSSTFPFKRPNNLAVRLLLALCTNSPISSRRTRTASVDRRIWAFFEGQTVVTNSAKLPPLRCGRLYNSSILAEYQALDTRAHAQKLDWEEVRRGMNDRMFDIISDGSRISREDWDGRRIGCGSAREDISVAFLLGRNGTLNGWDISMFQLL
jgi:hypothetical protein